MNGYRIPDHISPPADSRPLRITGEIGQPTLDEFRAILTAALPIGRPLVVDMRAVTFFSVRALLVLIEVQNLAAVRHSHLHVLGSCCVNRMLQLACLETEFGPEQSRPPSRWN